MPDTVTKERPILMSAPMVRAILDGRKSQTRRIVKFNHKPWLDPLPHVEYARDGNPIWWGSPPSDEIRQSDYYDNGYPCPYGQPGDLLWVRERHWFRKDDGITAYADGSLRTHPTAIFGNKYVQPDKPPEAEWPANAKQFGFKCVPSIHMPRWASRLTLELTAVRVERVQEISEADAEAEGVSAALNGKGILTNCQAFSMLWDQINGPGSWESSPWVWVLSFRRVESPDA